MIRGTCTAASVAMSRPPQVWHLCSAVFPSMLSARSQAVHLPFGDSHQTYCHTVGHHCSECFHGNLHAQAHCPSPSPIPTPIHPPPFVELVRSNAMKWPPNKNTGLCNNDLKRGTLHPHVSSLTPGKGMPPVSDLLGILTHM